MGGYVHGYEARENERLDDQAGVLAELLHNDTRYERGSAVLEAGCGTGAQSVILGRLSPQARFTSIDVSERSLAAAADRLDRAGIDNVELERADVLDLPFAPGSFDHAFVCFLLEHLGRPVDALRALRRTVRPGGTITVIEGDARSAFFHPDDPSAHAVIDCLVEVQARAGGDALIGRRLYPLLVEAGFADVRVSPRFVYADGSRPDVADRFTRRTFTAMVEGVREPAVAAGLVDAAAFDRGIAALHRTAEADGVFCFTFFKAVARTPAAGTASRSASEHDPHPPRGE